MHNFTWHNVSEDWYIAKVRDSEDISQKYVTAKIDISQKYVTTKIDILLVSQKYLTVKNLIETYSVTKADTTVSWISKEKLVTKKDLIGAYLRA